MSNKPQRLAALATIAVAALVAATFLVGETDSFDDPPTTSTTIESETFDIVRDEARAETEVLGAVVTAPPTTIDVEALNEFYAAIEWHSTSTTTAPPPPTTVYIPPPAPTNVDAHLLRIATCESGQNPTAVSSTGSFRGAWQFWHDGRGSTWLAYGGGEFASDPIYATFDQQFVVARSVYAGSGPGAWPVCQYR